LPAPCLVEKVGALVTPGKTVDIIVTEYALFRFAGGRMTLEEIAPEITLDELKSVTSVEYAVSPGLGNYHKEGGLNNARFPQKFQAKLSKNHAWQGHLSV
jgi:hypothetical protein